jgi:hypothetical protein
MKEIIDHDEAFDCINDLHYSDNPNNFTNNNKTFNNTRYVSTDCIKDFFKKFHDYPEINRKGNLPKLTPSYSFIKSSKENSIVPNPVGILKRRGEDNIVNLT